MTAQRVDSLDRLPYLIGDVSYGSFPLHSWLQEKLHLGHMRPGSVEKLDDIIAVLAQLRPHRDDILDLSHGLFDLPGNTVGHSNRRSGRHG